MTGPANSEQGKRQPVRVPPSNDDDPYTLSAKLCDDDGIVRRGAMHHGIDYPCTGHAHFAGEHIECISEAHPSGLPTVFLDAMRVLPDEDFDDLGVPAARRAELRARLQWIEGRA